MASAFAHIVVPAVLYAVFKSNSISFRLFILAAFLSIAPDLDVMAFKFGIPYESQWGHRGFTHSLTVAAGLAALFTLFKKQLDARPLVIFAVCFIACASHAILDAMTNGGLGVALYWPFSQERIFLPFRPIQVSPIGVAAFFTERGLKVIASEALWILAPGLILGFIGFLIRRNYTSRA